MAKRSSILATYSCRKPEELEKSRILSIPSTVNSDIIATDRKAKQCYKELLEDYEKIVQFLNITADSYNYAASHSVGEKFKTSLKKHANICKNHAKKNQKNSKQLQSLFLYDKTKQNIDELENALLR